MEWVYACYGGMGSPSRGRALTRVNRGWGGVGSWVRDLSEKRAREMGGNKGSGAVSSFWTHGSQPGRSVFTDGSVRFVRFFKNSVSRK